MNSIDQQQPEDNHKDLQGEDAVKKIVELTGKNGTCFFCTAVGNIPFQTRPMSVQKVDDDGNIWFMISNDSHTYGEIQQNNQVQLLFQGSAHSDFLSLYGDGIISTDKEMIKELWKPLAKAWFTEGVDDPRIALVRFEPVDGYYWDNKHGNAVALVKMAVGAMLGKTLDDSVTGKISV